MENKTENESTEQIAILKEKNGQSPKNDSIETATPVKSSSFTELAVCFDDDFEFHIDWEKELAKPFYNSTVIRQPRVPVPTWAEWDFSKNEILRQEGLENEMR